MSTSAIGTQCDAIQAGLAARSNLTSVKVFSGPISLEDAGLECIAFGPTSLTEVILTMGGNREETWTLEGETRVVKPWQGSTEETIAAARDRCLELFAEIETYLNDTYTGAIPNVDITSGEMEQSFNPDGRVCSLRFSATMTGVKNP